MIPVSHGVFVRVGRVPDPAPEGIRKRRLSGCDLDVVRHTCPWEEVFGARFETDRRTWERAEGRRQGFLGESRHQ
jgi:hypothetical protein